MTLITILWILALFGLLALTEMFVKPSTLRATLDVILKTGIVLWAIGVFGALGLHAQQVTCATGDTLVVNRAGTGALCIPKMVAVVVPAPTPTPPPVVTPPVVTTPPSGGSNEPAGMTRLAERGFSSVDTAGWYRETTPSNRVQLVNDPTAPRSQPWVVQQNFLPGLTGGSSPTSLGTGNFAPRKTLYVSLWMKLSPNFQGHPGSTNKVIHLYTSGSNRIYLALWGAGSGALRPGFGLQGLAKPYAGDGATGTSVNLAGSGTVTRGEWHRYEFVLVANTPGVADGSLALWVDGVSVLNRTGIAYNGSGTSSLWEEVNWSPTWGGGGGSISSAFSASMDHMYVSGK